MEDRRKQIPIGCAMNIAIINEFSKTDAFTKACIETPLKYGIKLPSESAPWPFFNISWGAYMMYCLFVVTKEIFNLKKDDIYFQKLIENNAMNDFYILKERHSFIDDPLYHFSCFRNAISHVNYTIENDKIKLWDHPPKKNQLEHWHWEVEISNKNFMNFLGLVNQGNFELYNEINSGIRDETGIKI